MITDISY